MGGCARCCGRPSAFAEVPARALFQPGGECPLRPRGCGQVAKPQAGAGHGHSGSDAHPLGLEP
eukprot:3674434-Alexandrium_andersonii.AAC.1